MASLRKPQFVTARSIYSFFHGKARVEEVRGHEASVRFKDGVLFKKPIIAEDSLFEDSGVNYSLTY